MSAQSPIPGHSLFYGLLSLASISISQPSLTLLYNTTRDSQYLRISPLFNFIDLVISTGSFIFCTSHGLTLTEAARAVLVFRACTDEDFSHGRIRTAVGRVCAGAGGARLLAIVAASMQLAKFCGMRGVWLEVSAGLMYSCCTFTTELLLALAARDDADWWDKADRLPEKIQQVVQRLRDQRSYYRSLPIKEPEQEQATLSTSLSPPRRRYYYIIAIEHVLLLLQAWPLGIYASILCGKRLRRQGGGALWRVGECL